MAKKIRKIKTSRVKQKTSKIKRQKKKETPQIERVEDVLPMRHEGKPLRILMAAGEMVPFAKTGGLADVVGALPKELARFGHQVITFLPLYQSVKERFLSQLKFRKAGHVKMDYELYYFELWEGNQIPGVTTFFIRNDGFFNRAGLYGENGHEYGDNARRFIFFNRAVAESLDLLDLTADLLHCHDWHAGLLPLLLGRHGQRRHDMATVLTIHNIAFQGVFDSSNFRLTGLPADKLSIRCLEFYGKMNLLKGGVTSSDHVTTVSEKYASEIQTSDFGWGLEGVLKDKGPHVSGILNGIDADEWNASRDPFIAKTYDAQTVAEGKLACKRELCRELELPCDEDVPLLGSITRLSWQKGVDLFPHALTPLLKAKKVRLVILGLGEYRLENMLWNLQQEFPGRVRIILKMDQELAHKIEAASDYFLMPSQFEPCGLNQMYSLEYGAVPIVRATGGLEDTVIHYDPKTRQGNGFKFAAYNADAFRASVEEALSYFHKPMHLAALRRNGMAGDYSWKKSALKYEELYRKLVKR